tara:strand:+ start:246 stop:965 length:720 start_codon:yes stop_codon:yes gene_type:complete
MKFRCSPRHTLKECKLPLNGLIFLVIKIPILALLAFGCWGFFNLYGGFLVNWLDHWQSLIGSFFGSFIAIALFWFQRREDNKSQKQLHFLASLHEIRRAVRAVKFSAPWNPIVSAQLKIRLSDDTASEKILFLKKNLTQHIDPLRCFIKEVLDMLDAVPRNNIENMSLIYAVDDISGKMTVAIAAINDIELRLKSGNITDPESTIETVLNALDDINQCWPQLDELYQNLQSATLKLTKA